ncbi:MAG: solute:sodium symporter family transporter [Lentisphaeria bacterium]
MNNFNYTLALSTFLLFTGGVAFLTFLITRKDDHQTNDGFFLGGRSLTFPLIAGSLLLTNLSTEQMVGLNGDAFTYGLSVMAWEVLAVIALVCMALFFLPRFLKSGITTVPEYLELRFDQRTGTLANFIFLAAYTVILLPIVLYTGAKGLISILDLKNLLHMQSEMGLLYCIVIAIGTVGAIYALFGGLRSVAVSDLLNGIGLLIGGILIVYFALRFTGNGDGVLAGIEKVYKANPEKFNSLGGAKSAVPFSTLFSGVLLINIFYWCTNQQIIQRTLGASSLAEGQKGVLLTGALKLIGPLYLIVPGLVAFYLYTNGQLPGVLRANGAVDPTLAYGSLVRLVLPTILTGFFAAVMVGAILSSFNSALNSTCTLFSLGLYRQIFHPKATDKQVVASGKWFGWIIAILAMLSAPLLDQVGSIFGYLQKMNGIYFIPLLAVILCGMLSKRVPAKAAFYALVGGCVFIAFCYFVPPFSTAVAIINDFNFLGLVFLYLVLGMLFYGEIHPRKEEFVQKNSHLVDLTPWKYARICGILLLVIVGIVYVYFADLSAILP